MALTAGRMSAGRESKAELQAAKDAMEEWQAQAQQAQGKLAVVESALAASEAQVLKLQQQIRDMQPVTPRIASEITPSSPLSAVEAGELQAELRGLRSQNAELMELVGRQVGASGGSTGAIGSGVHGPGGGVYPQVSSSTPLGLELDFSTKRAMDGGSSGLINRPSAAFGTDPPPLSPGRLSLSAHSSVGSTSGALGVKKRGHSDSSSNSSSARGSPRRGLPPAANELAIGDRLEIMSTRQAGAVAYVGPTHLGSGQWVGLITDDCCGKHDGSIGDRQYFSCKDGHGLLLKLSQVRRL